MLINSFQNQTNLADNFPPTTTTDTKSESCVIADSVGVVDSVGDALSHEFEQILSLCDTCLDLPSFMRCKDACSLSKDDTHVLPVIEFDISKKIDESLFQSCPFGSECTIPKTGSCTCENLGGE